MIKLGKDGLLAMPHAGRRAISTLLLFIGAGGGCRAKDSRRSAIAESQTAWLKGNDSALKASVPIDTVVTRFRSCLSNVSARVNGGRVAVDPPPSILAPAQPCSGFVYVWWAGMPLSILGIGEARAAARDLGVDLQIVDAESIYARIANLNARPAGKLGDHAQPTFGDSLAVTLVQAGATTHFPSAIAFTDGRFLGSAILGYKDAEGYRRLLKEKFASHSSDNDGFRGIPSADHGIPRSIGFRAIPASVGAGKVVKDLPLGGEQPGPYFKKVFGRALISIVVHNIVYLADIQTGRLMAAPAWVDFVPTPDGRYFVTPSRERGGLRFYDGDAVLAAAAKDVGMGVRPFFVDDAMRDEYPSVGIVQQLGPLGTRKIYRVVTGWYDGAILRDYEIESHGHAAPTARAVGPARRACAGRQVSLPVVSPDGTTLAVRDERTATTKFFLLDADGTCRELFDTGIATGKVAFDPTSRRAAFAIPMGGYRPREDSLSRANQYSGVSYAGIFVLDLSERVLMRLSGSESANRLTFPEFVGRDSIMFLLNRPDSSGSSVLRLICCTR